MPGFDYSESGYYFVTICTKNRIEFFGNIKNEEMVLNDCGAVASKYWNEIPEYYKNVDIDKFIIMPNHIHGIIIINDVDAVGTEYYSVPTDNTNNLNNDIIEKKPFYGLLSNVIKLFKRACTICTRQHLNDFEFGWQRSFYDHIICDEDDLARIQQYIINNSLKWHLDRNNLKKYN